MLGFGLFYIGSIMYNMDIIADKNLRPAPSGMLKEHILVKEGLFAIIRHLLYVLYMFILAGLSLILLNLWLLIPTCFMIIGIYPMAKAAAEKLIELFGDDYIEYKRSVGMFFPKIVK